MEANDAGRSLFRAALRCLAALWLAAVEWALGSTTGWIPALFHRIGQDVFEAVLGTSGFRIFSGVLANVDYLTTVYPVYLLLRVGIDRVLIRPPQRDPWDFAHLTVWGAVVIYGLPTLILVLAWRWSRRRVSGPGLEMVSPAGVSRCHVNPRRFPEPKNRACKSS